jgi:serine protease Do
MKSCLFILCVILACHNTIVQGQGANEFSTGIEYAQQRLVKIYGGTLGRSPGYATGIIISNEGHILTCMGTHLVANAIRISLPNGEQEFAQLLRSDKLSQLALLKIEITTPNFYNLEEAITVQRGDWVLALSNAFKVADGTEPLSVNLGVFTTRTLLDARRGVQDFTYNGDVLLYDAITSNPGAGGGAIVTSDGKLLGMIGKIIEGKNTNTRLNYAMPVDCLRKFQLNETSENPLVDNAPNNNKAGDLGIRMFALGGRKAPAFVDSTLPQGAAAKAGIKADDLVISVASQSVRNIEDFQKAVASIQAGQQVVVEVKRKNSVLAFTLTAGEKQ